MSEFSLTNQEVEHYTRVAELLNTDVNSLVTFSFSEQDDEDCFMKVINFIYQSKSSETYSLPSSLGDENEMIVNMKSWRIFIHHSSDDDIEITFINKHINKFKRQLLDKQN